MLHWFFPLLFWNYSLTKICPIQLLRLAKKPMAGPSSWKGQNKVRDNFKIGAQREFIIRNAGGKILYPFPSKDYLTWYVGITWGCCNSCCCCCDCSVRFTFWTWLALLVGRPLPFPEGELGLPWAEPFPFPGKKAPPSENSSRYITKEEIHLGDAWWSIKNPTITFPPARPSWKYF